VSVMITIFVVLLVLLLIGLIRGGVEAEYSESGFTLLVYFGILRIRLAPAAKKKKKSDKSNRTRKKRNKTRKKDSDASGGKQKGGALEKVLTVLPTVIQTLGRFLHSIRIDILTIRYDVQSDDPYDTAIRYAIMASSTGVLGPLIQKSFHVKEWNISFAPVFTDTPALVYIHAKASIAVWQVIYIIIRLDFKAIFSIL